MREQLATLVDQLRGARLHGVGWVNPWGSHMALKFLGNVATERVPAIQHALETAAQGQRPITLHLHELGGLPHLRSPRVLWVGLAGELETLLQLQDRLEKETVALGFPREERGFTPHLTLGRIRDRLSPQELDRLAVAVRAITPPELAFTIIGITLMQSILLPSGAEYRPLGQIQFVQPLSNRES